MGVQTAHRIFGRHPACRSSRSRVSSQHRGGDPNDAESAARRISLRDRGRRDSSPHHGDEVVRPSSGLGPRRNRAGTAVHLGAAVVNDPLPRLPARCRVTTSDARSIPDAHRRAAMLALDCRHGPLSPMRSQRTKTPHFFGVQRVSRVSSRLARCFYGVRRGRVGCDGGPVPFAFAAATVNVYATPPSSPRATTCLEPGPTMSGGCRVDPRYGVTT